MSLSHTHEGTRRAESAQGRKRARKRALAATPEEVIELWKVTVFHLLFVPEIPEDLCEQRGLVVSNNRGTRMEQCSTKVSCSFIHHRLYIFLFPERRREAESGNHGVVGH